MATQDKYDRQLRLWGTKGQQALGDTTVVLIRATAVGTECLKNLVLPGVGQIVVVDDVVVTDDDDQRSNFFVTSSSQPRPRAQTAMELLQELNPDVQGQWKHVGGGDNNDSSSSLRTVNMSQLLLSIIGPKDHTSNSKNMKLLIVAADVEPPLQRNIASACHELVLPLIVVQSYGLMGLVRLQIPPLPILDPKPDSDVPDLRLVHPFAELQQLVSTSMPSADWNQLTSLQHSHVPYPFILLRAMGAWKQQQQPSSNPGLLLPKTLEEKQQFRSSIVQASRNFDHELNFQEAANNAYLAYTERTLDLAHLQELSSKSAKAALSEHNGHECQKLHLLLQALDQFLKEHNGQAPLQGNIPDMTASTDLYVQLQNVYQTKAAKDLAYMRRLVPVDVISDEELAVFTKNVFHLDMIQTRTIMEEYNTTQAPNDELVEDWSMATFDPYEVPEHTPLLWYVGLRACHLYYDRHGCYPGVVGLENANDDNNNDDNNNIYENDVAELQQCIEDVVTTMRLKDNELVQQTLLSKEKSFAVEMTRYANAEIHTVASIVGGVASQEAVKIITGQYVPLDNTYIYNGIASTGGVYRF